MMGASTKFPAQLGPPCKRRSTLILVVDLFFQFIVLFDICEKLALAIFFHFQEIKSWQLGSISGFWLRVVKKIYWRTFLTFELISYGCVSSWQCCCHFWLGVYVTCLSKSLAVLAFWPKKNFKKPTLIQSQRNQVHFDNSYYLHVQSQVPICPSNNVVVDVL